jgi:aldose sugar dehydrogenase
MKLRSVWMATALAAVAMGASAQEKIIRSEKGDLRLTTVASGLEAPWGLAFLPDGRMLVTERPGRLRVVSASGQLSAPLEGVPRVFAMGQGGLLDVALDPGFGENRTLYLSYSEPVDGKARTAVARARLAGDRLEDVSVIFRQEPAVDARHHFGSRLVFDREAACT